MERVDRRPRGERTSRLSALTFADTTELLPALQRVARAQTLEEIQAEVVRTARRLTGADGVTFVLREGDEVHYANEEAISPLWRGRRFPVDACVSGWALEHRVSVIIEDVFADDRIPKDVYRQTFVKSLAIVPLGEGAPIAAVGAYWALRHQATRRELEILATLGNAAATALDRHALLERERAARATAEVAAENRLRLLAMAAHDLRTPLTTVLVSLIRLGEVPVGAGLDQRVRQLAEAIHRSALRMEGLIHTLLDYVPVSSQRLTLTTETTKVRTLLEMAEELQPLARDRQQYLRVQRAPRAVPEVRCDPGKVAQILSNVVGNAIRHTPAGTQISVEVEQVGEEVRFTVADDGPGIPPGRRARLFEPFGPDARQGSAGLGLGMSIARGLTEVHGGRLWLEHPARGTVVHFTLPLAVSGESAAGG